MSFTLAPSTAQRSWLYVSDPTTILGNTANEESLLCYAYAQGYNGLFLYKMANYRTGSVFPAGNQTLFRNFITKAKARVNDLNPVGIEVCGVYGGPETIDALMDYNNNPLNASAKFYGCVSELEWWNYSHNLPFQSQDDSGHYSFYDTIEFLKTRKAAMLASGLQNIAYLGFFRSANDIEDVGQLLEDFDIDASTITFRGVDPITLPNKQFEDLNEPVNQTPTQNQVIRIENFPIAGERLYFEVTNVANVSGDTQLTLSPSLASVFKATITTKERTANVATLTFSAPISTANPYHLQVGSRIVVSIGDASYDGNHVVTGVTNTTVSYANAGANEAPTADAGTVALRFSATPEHEVKYTYNVVSVNPGVGGDFLIKGDKTFRFTGANRVKKIALSDPANPLGTPLIFTVSSAVYEIVNKATRVTVVEDTTPVTAFSGWSSFFTISAEMNMDVAGYTNTTYTSSFGASSDVEQIYDLFDILLFHNYVPYGTGFGAPRYSRSRARIIQAGTAGANTATSKEVGFIVSAESVPPLTDPDSDFSGKWFEGAGGGSPKSVDDAYKYLVINISPTLPAQTGTPAYARLESDVNVNAWLDITDIAVFKDTLIRNLNNANGSRVYVRCQDDFVITGLPFPNSTPVSGYHCDDDMPSPIRSVAWTIQSSPGGATLTNQFTSTPTLNYTLPGTYVLRMTVDDGDISSYDEVTITIDAGVVEVTATELQAVLCNGGATGQLTASAGGGTPPYTYAWTGPGGYTGTGQTITGLYAGTYIVTVTDSLGNIGTDTIVLTEPTPININTLHTDVLCNGGSNGDATASASGGTGPYTYLWSNGGVTAKISGLVAGTYTVLVTDANGCTETAVVVVDEPTPLSFVSGPVDVTCQGGSNGEISLSINGGTAPYSVVWADPPFPTGEVRTGLAAGSYEATITDSNGCTLATGPIVIADGAPISVSISGAVATCNGQSQVFSATGQVGTPPYTYEWFVDGVSVGTGSTYNFPASTSGTFTIDLQMFDARGICGATATTTILVYPAVDQIQIEAVGAPLTFCVGSQVVLTAKDSGGGALNPSDVFWDDALNTNSDTITIDATYWVTHSIPAGPITFTATYQDVNGCTSTESVVVEYPASVTIDFILITPNPCGGPGNLGAIDAQIVNGCAPFTYSWTGPGGFTATTQDISGLVNGTYTLTVTDALLNTDTKSAVIATSSPDVTGVVTNSGCQGQANGAINTTVVGGTAPYTYLWNDGVTTPDRANLFPGRYRVFVTDANGCSDSAAFFVTADTGMDLQLVLSGPSPAGSDNGSILAVPSGGTPPYTYLWNTGATTAQINDVGPGTYRVEVTSASGCMRYASITVPDADVQDDMLSLQCCAASMTYLYVSQRRNGQWDEAKCTMNSLMLLLGYIKDICRHMDDGCFTDEEIRQLKAKANQICGCCSCSKDPFDDTLN